MNVLKVNDSSGFLESRDHSNNSFNSDKKQRIIEIIESCAEQGKWPGVHKMCKSLGVAPSTFYDHLNYDPDFKRAYEDALCALEDQCVENLMDQGKKANGITANIFLLKNIKRNRWNDGFVNLSVDSGRIKEFVGANHGFVDAEIVPTESKGLPPSENK